MEEKVIVYFTWSNNTKELVDGINHELHLPTYRLERKEPYSSNYHQCAYVEAKKEHEEHLHPKIKDLGVDLHNYKEILLFFPIWWYTYPMVFSTLLEGLKDYQDEIILFANSYTNDPIYMENSLKDARTIAPNVSIKEGLFNQSIKDHINFIKKL